MKYQALLWWFLPVIRATEKSLDKPKSKDSLQVIETAETTMKEKQTYSFILLVLSSLKAWHRLCFLNK